MVRHILALVWNNCKESLTAFFDYVFSTYHDKLIFLGGVLGGSLFGIHIIPVFNNIFGALESLFHLGIISITSGMCLVLGKRLMGDSLKIWDRSKIKHIFFKRKKSGHDNENNKRA